MARARLVFLLICLLLTPLLCAQETASPKPAQETAAPEPAKETASPEPAKEPQPPAPVFGMDTTGTLDVGYRWNVGLRGSEDLYRSLVNLGEGPRLLGANLTMNSPLGAGKYVDRLQLNASAWGGDPYNTLRLFAEKSGAYQFSFDYRKVNYFNFIPTLRESSSSQGIFLGQHSFDSTRRTMDFDLTLRPGATVSPFIAYSRNSGFGPGVTTFTADENEFAVTNQLRDTSDYYRGGVHFNLSRMNLTLEQGFLTFKDDQRIYQTGGTNTGNRTTPSPGTERGSGTAGRKLPFPGDDARQPRAVDRHTLGQADGRRPVCVQPARSRFRL